MCALDFSRRKRLCADISSFKKGCKCVVKTSIYSPACCLRRVSKPTFAHQTCHATFSPPNIQYIWKAILMSPFLHTALGNWLNEWMSATAELLCQIAIWSPSRWPSPWPRPRSRPKEKSKIAVSPNMIYHMQISNASSSIKKSLLHHIYLTGSWVDIGLLYLIYAASMYDS